MLGDTLRQSSPIIGVVSIQGIMVASTRQGTVQHDESIAAID